MATNYNFTFGASQGNTIQMVVQVIDFSGNIVNTTNVSSISLTLYPPGAVPPASALTTVSVSPNSINSWLGYYNIPTNATIGTYTAVVNATTISNFFVNDFSRFRVFPIDA